MKQIHLKVVVYIIGIFIVFTYGNSCGQSEYELSTGDCCPMCTPGNVVLKDCTEDTSTTCIPCVKGTFMNEPNGLHRCFACKTCDNGLLVSKECTIFADAVCEVMEGYYCNEFSKRECSHALPYSICAPGQQMKSPGTKKSDVVCEECPPGFYSPNGTSCHRWTDCYSKGEDKEKDGSLFSDVQCKSKRRSRHGLWFPVAMFMCLVSIFLVILLKKEKSLAALKPTQPSIPTPTEEVSRQYISVPEENQEERFS